MLFFLIQLNKKTIKQSYLPVFNLHLFKKDCKNSWKKKEIVKVQ